MSLCLALLAAWERRTRPSEQPCLRGRGGPLQFLKEAADASAAFLDPLRPRSRRRRSRPRPTPLAAPSLRAGISLAAR